jgi:hypothetical protein
VLPRQVAGMFGVDRQHRQFMKAVGCNGCNRRAAKPELLEAAFDGDLPNGNRTDEDLVGGIARIARQRVQEIVAGRRTISPETALRLAISSAVSRNSGCPCKRATSWRRCIAVSMSRSGARWKPPERNSRYQILILICIKARNRPIKL